MKITFKDGSFISFNSSDENDKLNVIICGLKRQNEVTMSSLDLDVSEVQEIIEFLQKWCEEPGNS